MFPVSPPLVATSEPEDDAGPEFSAEAYEALAEDMPSRLRPSLLNHAKKHAREEDAPCTMTSSTFFSENDSGWDLDDAQLYSGESLLLTSDAPPSSPVPSSDTLRTPQTSAQLVSRFLDSVLTEVADCGPDMPCGHYVVRVDTEAVLQRSAATQMYGLIRRCARDTEKALAAGISLTDPVPRTLMDIDAHMLAQTLALLGASMRLQPVDIHLGMDYAVLETQVQHATYLLLCAKCCLLIFSFDQLPKFLFSEELLDQCLCVIKPSLETVMLPLVEACASPAPTDLANDIVHGKLSPAFLSTLDTHFHHVCSTLALLEPLFRIMTVTIPESLMIRCVFLALSPFFTQDRASSAKHTSDVPYTHAQALRPVRLSCFHILRNLFSFYPQQRGWVLSEILVSLLQLPDLRHKRRHFRVSTGRKIYVITALLLQLIQAASYETPAAYEQSLGWFMDANVRTEQSKPPCQLNQESVCALASSTASFLVQRGAEAKMVKSSSNVSYAAVVYAMLEDLLILVFLPEWPAAPMLLSCFMRLFVTALQEPKSSLDARTMALDHLGVAAACIYTAEHQRTRRRACIKSMSNICADNDIEALQERQWAHFCLMHRLRSISQRDSAAAVAASFHRSQYLFELSLAMHACNEKSDANEMKHVIAQLVQNVNHSGEVGSADASLLVQLVLHSTLFVSYMYLLAPIVQCVRSPVLSVRLRALRALGNVAGANLSLLDDARIRDTIVTHLTDASASVREVSVSILASYLLHVPAQVSTYFHALSERVMDTAVSVRKRVVRFLYDAYVLNLDDETKRLALLRMLRCMHDIDPTVQQLAQEYLEHVLLDERDGEDPTVMARLLADLCVQIRERPSPLDEFLRRLSKDSKSDTYKNVLGTLVDELVGGLFHGDMEASTMRERLRVVYMLCEARPSVLTVNRAKLLLPYVDGAESPDDITVMEELLRIFALCIGHMPRTAKSFAIALENLLTRLLSRCTLAPGSSALEALVVCFCRVIHTQTHNTALLDKVYTSCLSKFFQVKGALDGNAFLILCITTLLCAHGHWAAHKSHINDVFAHLMSLFDGPDTNRVPVLVALGYVLSAYPSKFLDPLASKLDGFLQLGSVIERHLVLRVFLAFLKNDANVDVSSQNADVLESLTGQAFVDAGLASGLIQRFATPILDAALDATSPTMQRTAVEILKIAILQGLSHPMQVVPALVALETSDDFVLRTRAAQLHRHLASKHASLLATRYAECIRASFEFQQRTHPASRGFRQGVHTEALFQVWYDMLADHRSMRLGFLRTLVRLMDIPSIRACTDSDVYFALYVADNLAMLEYRLAEEPLLIVHELKMLGAVVGSHVTSLVERKLRADENQRSPSPLTDEESEENDEQNKTNCKDGDDDEDAEVHEKFAEAGIPKTVDLLSLTKAASQVRMIRALRQHIKHLYSLSEKKCAKYEPGKRTAFSDRAIARRSNENGVFAFPILLPQAYEDVKAYLEEFVDEADDIGSESDIE